MDASCPPPTSTPPSGYRPGKLSLQLQEAITAEAHQLEELEEPLAVIAGVGDVSASLDDALAELALRRLKAIADLR